MNNAVNARRLLLVSCVSFALTFAFFVVQARAGTGGRFLSTLDEPYIHLAIARTLAEHGTLGPVPGSYESASSSPVWSLLLALSWKLLPEALARLTPFFFAFLAALTALVQFHRESPFRVLPTAMQWIAATILPLSLYLVGLTFIGLEHALHGTLCLTALLQLRASLLTPNALPSKLALAVLLSSFVRPEGALIAAGCSVALVLHHRKALLHAVFVSIAGLLPIALLGALNLAHGRAFLPSSVLSRLWMDRTRSSGRLVRFLENATFDAPLTLLLVLLAAYASYGIFQEKRRSATPLLASYEALAVATTGLLHLLFARVGHLERYQSYLWLLVFWTAFRTLSELHEQLDDHRVRVRIAIAGTFLFCFPLHQYHAQAQIPVSSASIFHNQVQLGTFFARYYQGRTIIVNDLGIVGLEHRGPLIDLMGIGSHEVIDALRTGTYNQQTIERLAREKNAVVVGIYREQFPFFPSHWPRAGVWIEPAWTATDGDISFFGTTPENTAELRTHLRAFQTQMPPAVRVHIDP